MTQLLYLVNREALSSVFASQVLAPLEQHLPHMNVTLGLLTPPSHLWGRKYKPAIQQISDRCLRSGIKVGWLPAPPTRFPRLWSESFIIRQWASKRFTQEQTIVVRCRNSTSTRIALDAFRGNHNAKIIYDSRGAEVTEAIQQLGLESQPEANWPTTAREKLLAARTNERRAIQESAGVTCVSQAMVDQLRASYPEQPANKFFVIPCCPDTAAFSAATTGRDQARHELGLTHKLVVTYLGSLVWYQLPEASFRIFLAIKSIRPDAHFLAITTNPAKMRELALTAGLQSDEITIRSVPSNEVPRLLVASDLGLMLRDNSMTNRVASPVKFGEYMAAGVPVIITPQLGDYSEAVRTNDLGVEVNLNNSDLDLAGRLRGIAHQSNAETEQRRNRCIQFAESQLSWPPLITRLVNWYDELSHSSKAPAHTNQVFR